MCIVQFMKSNSLLIISINIEREKKKINLILNLIILLLYNFFNLEKNRRNKTKKLKSYCLHFSQYKNFALKVRSDMMYFLSNTFSTAARSWFDEECVGSILRSDQIVNASIFLSLSMLHHFLLIFVILLLIF